MSTSNVWVAPQHHRGLIRLVRKPSRWLLSAVLSAHFLAGGGASAQPAAPLEQLTLERAVQLSLRHSRQLPAQDAMAESARHMAVAAGQRPDLTLKLGINNLPVTGSDAFNLTNDFMTMASIGVMRELTSAAKLKARSARFEREADVALAERAMTQINLGRDTATAWLERHFQERMQALMGAQRDEARLQVEGAEATYRGGRGSQTDVFAARALVAQIDERLQQIEQNIAVAKTRLSRWVGPQAHQPLAAAPDLTQVPLRSGGLEELLKSHPSLAVLEKQEGVARAEADVAQTEKKSDWSMELMFSQRGPAYSNMVSINFSLPLQNNQASRQDRELAARLSRVEQLQAQREEAVRERAAEAGARLQQWQGNRKRLDAYDRDLIPLAALRTQAALAAYRGNGPLQAVLEARRMEIDTHLERLRLEMETAALWAQLNYLIAGGHDTTAVKTPASSLEN